MHRVQSVTFNMLVMDSRQSKSGEGPGMAGRPSKASRAEE